MSTRRSVIVTCAVTGSVHTPTMSEYLPITPRQIADQAIAAAQAGASVLHLHARDPSDGRPTPDPEVFMQFLPQIRAHTDAIVNITTGGGQGMSVEQRMAAALRAKPELCSLNMGSMNFGLFPAADRYSEWKHDWEQPFLMGTKDFIFRNTFADIERILRDLGEQHGARFEFECYDVGHLYTLAHFLERGLVQAPLFIQFVMGILGGIGPDPENLHHMIRIADKLFAGDYVFSVLGAGRHQMPLCTLSALAGGNVRVGLEDSLSIRPRTLAQSNAEQVTKIRRILSEYGFEVATPTETRERLQLKGAEKVSF